MHRLCERLNVSVFPQPGRAMSPNRIKGGVGSVVSALANSVRAHEGEIYLEHAVSSIAEEGGGVIVTATSNGTDIHIKAKAVVRY